MQRKIYKKDEHRLENAQIDTEALYVLEKLTAAGHTAYLVGGGVRDLLLKQKPKDYDISTSAKPEEIRKLFRNCFLIGKRFRLAHIRFGNKIIEVATFRSGDNEADTLIIRDNEWGTEEEDVLRRDFTINGLFYDACHETIIDYVGGFQDLRDGYLRTIGQSFLRFKQDPVRMLRLLKFKARFDFTVDAQAETALVECRHEILKSSKARVLEELLRMLESGHAASFVRQLTSYGFLQLILPSIATLLSTDEGEEVYALLEALDAHEAPLDRAISLACLLFPSFSTRLHMLFQEDAPPHFAQIQNEAFSLFHELMDSFLQIPKRLKLATVFVLATQYRLVPLYSKKNKPFRVPNDPWTPLAASFLALRATLHPSLESMSNEWQACLIKHPLTQETAPKKPRRRKKRSPPA